MLPSKVNSQRVSSHEAFEQSLETLKQLSTDHHDDPKEQNSEEEALVWEDAADDIATFLQQFSNR